MTSNEAAITLTRSIVFWGGHVPAGTTLIVSTFDAKVFVGEGSATYATQEAAETAVRPDKFTPVNPAP